MEIGVSKDSVRIDAIAISETNSYHTREANRRPKVLFTSLIHPNEFVSVSFFVYSIFHLAFMYYRNSTEVVHLLQNREVWFVPILNPDGLLFLENHFLGTKDLAQLTKNRNGDENECGKFDS